MNFFLAFEAFSDVRYLVGNRQATLNLYRLDDGGSMILNGVEARIGDNCLFIHKDLPRQILYLVSDKGEIREIDADYENFDGEFKPDRRNPCRE